MDAGEVERIISAMKKLNIDILGDDLGYDFAHNLSHDPLYNQSHIIPGLEGISVRDSARDRLREMRIVKSAPTAFFGAAARLVLFECQRCSRCCIENKHIALRPDDCIRIADRLGLSTEDFLAMYTLESADPHQAGMGAREIRKSNEMHCPFYDESQRGCSIYDFRPAVCRCYPTITEDVIQAACRREMLICVNCPASVDLSQRVLSLISDLGQGSLVEILSRSFFCSADSWPFFVTLYLKACRAVFGQDISENKRNALGMRRLASDEEIADLALLFLGVLAIPRS
jgi:Fe-S-cluster containining protein